MIEVLGVLEFWGLFVFWYDGSFLDLSLMGEELVFGGSLGGLGLVLSVQFIEVLEGLSGWGFKVGG